MPDYKKGSFIVVPNKQVVMKLRGAALNVYLCIVDHADNDGRCFPSYNRISAETGYQQRQCIKAVQELVEVGLIQKMERSRNDGGQTSNSYQVMLVDAPESAPAYTQGSAPQDTSHSAPDVTPLTQPIVNSPTKNSLSASPSAPTFNEEDVRLTDLLHDLVVEQFPFIRDKPPTDKDYAEMNRIARIDEKPYPVIELAIRYALNDSFWKTNIRSVTKLRKQMDTLLIRAKSDHDKRQGRVGVV